MKLSDLHPSSAYTKKGKRIGRGPGSGHGKTSCRGHKGRKARSGGTIPTGYEGGQMPLHRRLPKRGFTNIFKKSWVIINLEALNQFDDESVVDYEGLKNRGMIKKNTPHLKILGSGELKKKLTVKAHHFSVSAQEKITRAGGKTERLIS